MKTITQLKSEIESTKELIRYEMKNRPEGKEDKRTAKETRLRNELSFLNMCVHYIETDPSGDFVRKEIERIEKRIELRMSGWQEGGYTNISKTDVTQMRQEYEKLHEIPKLKTQLRALKFLAA